MLVCSRRVLADVESGPFAIKVLLGVLLYIHSPCCLSSSHRCHLPPATELPLYRISPSLPFPFRSSCCSLIDCDVVLFVSRVWVVSSPMRGI